MTRRAAGARDEPEGRAAWVLPTSVQTRPLLYAVTMGGALLEAIGLRAAGMVGTLPLAAQASAVAPVMAFHDDRWLFVYANSWPVLAAELLAAVAVRTVMMAACISAAWPKDLPRPPMRRVLGRGAVAYAALVVAMSPWALLSFVTAVMSVSYPLAGAVVGAGLLGVFVLPHAGVAGRWWAHLPPLRAMAWTAADILVVTAGAIAIAYSPGWVVLAAAGAAGALNGRCWQGLVRACAVRAATHGEKLGAARRALVPAWSASAIVGLTVLMASIVPYVGGPFFADGSHRAQPLPHQGERTVLLVDGYQSRWSGGAPYEHFRGFYTTEFSYRGLGPKGRPLPYGSTATTRSLHVLVRRFAAQVDRLRRLTGRRVDVVAVSEGTLVLRDYLAHTRSRALHTVVFASPLPRPDRVYAPPSGHSGFGMAATAEIGALLEISRAEQPNLDVNMNLPILRSLLAQGPLFRQRSLCPVPGITIVALLPMTAAIDDPPGPVGGVDTSVAPDLHAHLIQTAAVRREVASLLHGKPLSRHFGWGLAFQLLRYASSIGEVPSLPLGSVPAWRRAGGTRWGDAALGSYGCPAVDHPSATALPRRAR